MKFSFFIDVSPYKYENKLSMSKNNQQWIIYFRDIHLFPQYFFQIWEGVLECVL